MWFWFQKWPFELDLSKLFGFKLELWFWFEFVITVRVLTIRSTVFCVSKKSPWHQAHPLFFWKWTWNIVFSICGHDVVCSVSRNRLTRSWIELLVFSVQMLLCLHFFFAIVWWCVFVDFSILFSSVCLCTITHNMLLFWLMSAFECLACIIFKYNLNGISSCSLLSDAAQQTTANYTTNFFFQPKFLLFIVGALS